jgi:hypothetical protein
MGFESSAFLSQIIRKVYMLKKIKSIKQELKKGSKEVQERKTKFIQWENAGSPGLSKKKEK